MSADGSFPQPWNISAPSRNAPEHECDGIWPVDPDPNLTKLSGRQLWHFRAGMPVGIDVNGVRMDAGDARIALLGIRRDARAHPYPAIFTHAPATGEPLRSPIAAEEPATLDIDRDSVFEIPLPSGVPVLVRTGRPAGLYLFQENLGALEIWDGRAFRSFGRLPAAAPGTTLTATPEGISTPLPTRWSRWPFRNSARASPTAKAACHACASSRRRPGVGPNSSLWRNGTDASSCARAQSAWMRSTCGTLADPRPGRHSAAPG